MHLRLRERSRVRLADERGFTMATAMLALLAVTVTMVGTVAAVNGDINLTAHDMEHKRAYEAAQAGIADYAFHLNKDNGYWSKCADVPAPSAVNEEGSTANRRPVPGGGAEYAIELLPATGKSSCDTGDPVGSMIEQSGPATGTFRIRSTGYYGGVEQRIVASFKRASFLDFVYFTQFETSDPVVYPDSEWRAWAANNCAQTREEGRPMPPASPSRPYCTEISFTDDEAINGPFHTNDSISTSGDPVFGRGPSDMIEVSAPDPGCYTTHTDNECTKTVNGTWLSGASVLTPPPTNAQLRHVPGVKEYEGQVHIELSGDQMTVYDDPRDDPIYSGAIPSSGVVYVSQEDCSSAYSPFTASYQDTSGCGNAIVEGSYSGRLTIAAENDIIISDDTTRSSDDGMLGLIANNFVRIKHPCSSGSNRSGTLVDPEIDAAILAIQHSFVVDRYDCGDPIGELTVTGAIAQKFRGPVGTFYADSGETASGYVKDYNYDDRLRYIAPPHFLDPVEAAWHMQRQTLAP